MKVVFSCEEKKSESGCPHNILATNIRALEKGDFFPEKDSLSFVSRINKIERLLSPHLYIKEHLDQAVVLLQMN